MATLHTDPTTGRETFTGFSWSTLFFGPLPALFRRDWLGAVIGLGIVAVLLVAVTVVLDVTGEQWMAQLLSFGVWVIWAAMYNSNHAARVAGR